LLFLKKNPILIKISLLTKKVISDNNKDKIRTTDPLIIINKYTDINPYKKIFFPKEYSIE
jgi:hypothetical protein